MKLAQTMLPFKIQLAACGVDTATAHGGLPLVVEALRAAVPASLFKTLAGALGQSWKTVRRHIETCVALMAAGGDCIDDVESLRADAGLACLLGNRPSSATQLKDFLYRFHQAVDGRALTPDDDRKLSVQGRAQLRPEGPGLRALAALSDEVVRQLQRDRQKLRATLDCDATIVEASKKGALVTYEGSRGYQPQMAWWAEQEVFVLDEFRDGNVPAELEAKSFLQRAFSALPGSVSERRMRADSAFYNEGALTWVHDNGIQFCVSADMSRALNAKVRDVPEPEWKAYTTLRRDGTSAPSVDEERQWAEVEFVPEWGRNLKKHGKPFRYIAIRVRSRQGELWDEGEDGPGQWRHFAIVTNMDWDGLRLLQWHREKQGTVEHAHHIMKNELAGGTLPCGRFGANAAWWRLNALLLNLLQWLKVRALPAETLPMRPKALRFHLLNIVGILIRHARRVILRLSQAQPGAGWYAKARESLAELVRAHASPAPAP